MLNKTERTQRAAHTFDIEGSNTYARKTLVRMDICQNGYMPEWTLI